MLLLPFNFVVNSMKGAALEHDRRLAGGEMTILPPQTEQVDAERQVIPSQNDPMLTSLVVYLAAGTKRVSQLTLMGNNPFHERDSAFLLRFL